MLPDDPDAQARLFYMSALGLLVAGGLVSAYRDRMGQALQHAAIWGLIFVGVVLAIGFADPLKRQLFNDEPLQIDENTVALDRKRDDHFYATLQINGKNIDFVVDTGATDLVLSRQDAERAGIDMNRLRFNLPAQTANGQVMGAYVRLESVRLGPFTDYDIPATVNGGELGTSLLGMAYLSRYRGFEVNGDRMYLKR
ncbi:MAG: TIGR02281 family clan AA aspartic protease [Pseudomonadota bacterium]